MDLHDPTAQGDLARTPFAHLLVFALDRRLTGVLYLDEAPGVSHAVSLERGAIVHVTSVNGFARLGKLLVEEGRVTPAALSEALGSTKPLGAALVAAGQLAPEPLEQALDEQLQLRVLRLFMLPSTTTYRYFEGHEPIAPQRLVRVDPLGLLWQGLRAHAECSAMFEGTLARLTDAPLHLHPLAPLRQLGLVGDERLAVGFLAGQPSSPAELVEAGIIGEAPLRRLVYALLITRMLQFGGAPSDFLPVTTEPLPPPPPPSSASPSSPPPSSAAPSTPRAVASSTPLGSASLGRVKLVKAAVRVGALLGEAELAGAPASLRSQRVGGVIIDEEPASSLRGSDPRAELEDALAEVEADACSSGPADE
jgi:hypothetical protein